MTWIKKLHLELLHETKKRDKRRAATVLGYRITRNMRPERILETWLYLVGTQLARATARDVAELIMEANNDDPDNLREYERIETAV